MKFLEDADVEHLKPKFVSKIILELISCYIHMNEPEFESSYVGKITSGSFNTIKEVAYSYFDKFGLGGLENTEEIFGEALAEILDEKKSRIKKIATARVIFSGKKSLVDYNWNVKLVQSSDMIRNFPSYLIQVEFLLMNEHGNHEKKLVEFSQEEFSQFVGQLESCSLTG